MRAAFVVLRILGAVAVVAAIVGQLAVSLDYWTTTGVHDLASSIVNFFSFFTIQSNIIAAVTFAIGAVLLVLGTKEAGDPGWFGVLRACATTYMVTTGIVYNLLLRGIELPQGSTLPWSNEVLHLGIPILALVDWLFAPGRRSLGWGTVGIVVIYPIVWLAYTMIRGPFVYNDLIAAQGWYPYPFLSPLGSGGYAAVALWTVIIAALIAAVGFCTVSASRRLRST